MRPKKCETNQKDKFGLVDMELVSIVALEKDWLVWNWFFSSMAEKR